MTIPRSRSIAAIRSALGALNRFAVTPSASALPAEPTLGRAIIVPPSSTLRLEPATPEQWTDVVTLFGPHGACAGCWCMYWRREARAHRKGKGRGNREALRRLVAAGRAPGILAYEGGVPVGWCAVAPRAEYPRLAQARVLRPIDDQPVWSVVCLFVARGRRREGISVALLEGAAAFALGRGARILEGYPVEPPGPAMPDAFAWTGTAAAFRRAGFREVARGSPTRPIMRRALLGA